MTYSFPVRLGIIIIALFTALACVIFILKPWVYEPLCLVDSNNCLEIEYWTLHNSVIAHAVPTGYWIWYNGRYVYIFGEQTGRTCPNTDFQPVYVIDASENKILGYQCIQHFDGIFDYYKNYGEGKKSTFKRLSKFKQKTFNVFDMVNVLIDKDIIYVP